MKAYLAVTGALFALLTIAHIWRGTVESSLWSDPFFIITKVLSVFLCGWAVRLLRAMRAGTASSRP